ncbi:MAG: FkbM family methyltransferase [Lamprobacter sp.]|uniref:FkbM family methyltransferase n=1 Tax=Lamprobacter sp. TaxID=3100796 RepID=UPI002B262DBF|nr:FkbM family methyltransferase [Lamprobacter sp.]MEA3643573.1 FkbM family methyltransferase [Lamprobacter sp.]
MVDIGANPIDGTPPYAGLLKQGVIRLVGFEPQPDALAKLQQRKGPHETYLPHAVGNGEQATLYICQASGMTSTLKPNTAVLDHFQGYPIWGKVKRTALMDTVRLDDVPEISHIDWLKIDIQGGELTVFKHGEHKLKDTLVIQTEANFIQLYEGQPLFADIDHWMRAHGFMLHTLLEQRRRLYAPMKLKGGIHQGINQLTTADAVYIRDINQLDTLSTDQLKKLAVILHVAYGSYDLSLRLLRRLGPDFDESAYLKQIGKPLPLTLSAQHPISDAAEVHQSNAVDDAELDAVEMIFVVGCGHTGTTLMATILGESDAIHTIKRETEWFLHGQDFSTELRQEREQAIAAGKRCLLEKTPRHVYRYAKITAAFPNAKFVIDL